jgi:hypothetical protein
MDSHFKRQRDVADHASDELSRVWFQKMKGIFQEINERGECIQPAEDMFFLDLGLVWVLFSYPSRGSADIGPC